MPIEIVSLDAIRHLLAAAKPPCLIDVGSPAEFGRVHARGAESIPLDRLRGDRLAVERAGEPIYFICQSGARSAKACEKMLAAGFATAYSIEGGTAAWEAAGMPVERGTSRMISLERQVRIAAGGIVGIGVILTLEVSRAFLVIPAFVGCGLIFAGITDYCGMGMLLARMPWNNRMGATACKVSDRPSGSD